MLENETNVTTELGASNAPTCYPSRMDYDPNLTLSGNMAKQTVRLIFGRWHYRAERIVQVGGNCTGLSVITSAVRQAFDALDFTEYEGREYARITMLSADETAELTCEDEDYDCDDWLAEMLISAEIIEITADAGEDEDNK
jgi:hypothetical protein